ncbi:MAG: helix-turn-helix transcriptional regulator [Candidatus Saccharibacteria bacterium]|nr:helix-turn-helix transcriptional regulator [Pseudorhodobacter sp.]
MDRTNEPLMSAFAEVLQRRRRAAGLTQEQLAEKADVSVRFISFLETRRRQPTLTVIAAISRGLGITMAEFAADIEATVAMAKGVRAPD